MNGDSWRWAEWVDGAVTLVLGTAARMPVGEMKAASDSWRPAVSATVFYRGAWTGLLRVGCDWTAAESFAERFVGLPAGGRIEVHLMETTAREEGKRYPGN